MDPITSPVPALANPADANTNTGVVAAVAAVAAVLPTAVAVAEATVVPTQVEVTATATTEVADARGLTPSERKVLRAFLDTRYPRGIRHMSFVAKDAGVSQSIVLGVINRFPEAFIAGQGEQVGKFRIVQSALVIKVAPDLSFKPEDWTTLARRIVAEPLPSIPGLEEVTAAGIAQFEAETEAETEAGEE